MYKVALNCSLSIFLTAVIAFAFDRIVHSGQLGDNGLVRVLVAEVHLFEFGLVKLGKKNLRIAKERHQKLEFVIRR